MSPIFAGECLPTFPTYPTTIEKNKFYYLNGTNIIGTNYRIDLAAVTGSNGVYTWTYTAALPAATNQLSGLIPVCCPDLNAVGQEGSKVIPPPMGDSTTGFGVGNLQNAVLRFATSNQTTYYFSASTAAQKLMSVQLKSGKITYFAAVEGPSCAEWAQNAVTTTKSILTEEGNEFAVQTDPFTQCEVVTQCKDAGGSVYTCREILLSDLKLDHPGTETLNPIKWVSTPGAGCVNFIIKTNPATYCSGGRCWY